MKSILFRIPLLILMFVAVFTAQAQEKKIVSCPWSDGQDWFVWEIDDNKQAFRFMTTLDYGLDALSKVPHKEAEKFREYVVTFSKSKIEHCRLNKPLKRTSCHTLNRLTGTHTYVFGDNEPKITKCQLGLPSSKF
jgi:hypothetical protein